MRDLIVRVLALLVLIALSDVILGDLGLCSWRFG
jgi:hypothetical protein